MPVSLSPLMRPKTPYHFFHLPRCLAAPPKIPLSVFFSEIRNDFFFQGCSENHYCINCYPLAALVSLPERTPCPVWPFRGLFDWKFARPLLLHAIARTSNFPLVARFPGALHTSRYSSLSRLRLLGLRFILFHLLHLRPALGSSDPSWFKLN